MDEEPFDIRMWLQGGSHRVISAVLSTSIRDRMDNIIGKYQKHCLQLFELLRSLLAERELTEEDLDEDDKLYWRYLWILEDLMLQYRDEIEISLNHGSRPSHSEEKATETEDEWDSDTTVTTVPRY